MADRYPLFLDLAGRPCLVVGGGRVAARKIAALEAAGARITVVAPQVVAAVDEAAHSHCLTWHRREFRAADVDGKELVFAATSAPTVNRRVAEEGRRQKVWVNLADDPVGSDFHVPATLRRGPVAVAVGTAGDSPALAAWIRDRVSDQLPPQLETLARLAGALRRAGGGPGGDVGPFRSLFESGVLESLGCEDWAAVEAKVLNSFGDGEVVRQVLRDSLPEER